MPRKNKEKEKQTVLASPRAPGQSARKETPSILGRGPNARGRGGRARREVQQGQVALMKRWLQEGRTGQRSPHKVGKGQDLRQGQREEPQEMWMEGRQKTASGDRTGIGDIRTDKECTENKNIEQ